MENAVQKDNLPVPNNKFSDTYNLSINVEHCCFSEKLLNQRFGVVFSSVDCLHYKIIFTVT